MQDKSISMRAQMATFIAIFLTVTGQAAELKVTLFGQPCVLKGPMDASQLKMIHAISPEQLFEVDAAAPQSREQISGALEKLSKVGIVPAQLERYRERLRKRLTAQIEFFDAYAKSKKAKNADSLVELSNAKLTGKIQKDFEALAKATKFTDGERDKLFETYSDGIEADPEEDFHRGIQKMGIQYVCAFDEGAGSE